MSGDMFRARGGNPLVSYMSNNKLFFTILTMVIVLLLSLWVGSMIIDSSNNELITVKKAVLIDNPQIFDHELKTNDDFNVVVYGDLTTDKPVNFSQFLKDNSNYIYIEFESQRYTRHETTETVEETDSKGKTTKKEVTKVTYSWDNIDSGHQTSPYVYMLGKQIPLQGVRLTSTHSLRLTPDMVATKYQGKMDGSYLYERGTWETEGNIRHSLSVVDNNGRYSLATKLSDDQFKSLTPNMASILFQGSKEELVKSMDFSTKVTYFLVGFFIVLLQVGTYFLVMRNL